jgi:hypothetical protein
MNMFRSPHCCSSLSVIKCRFVLGEHEHFKLKENFDKRDKKKHR